MFLLSKTPRQVLELNKSPIELIPGAPSVGVKRLGRVVNDSRPSFADVKYDWSYASTPPVCLREVVSDNFNLYLRLVLPSGVICSGFSTKTLNTFRLSHIHATCPSHPSPPPWYEQPDSWREVHVMKLNFIPFYPPSCCIFPMGPNIFLHTLFCSTRRTRTTFVSGVTSRSRVDNLSTLK